MVTAKSGTHVSDCAGALGLAHPANLRANAEFVSRGRRSANEAGMLSKSAEQGCRSRGAKGCQAKGC
eukprot:scaffold14951_cov60-Phaeocystis_antarctica.AAC.4